MYDARLKACKYENVFRSLDSFVFPKWKNEDGEEISVRTSFAIRTESKVSAADFDCHRFQYDHRVKMSRGIYTIHFGDTKKIFYNDMVRGGQAATRYYLESNDDDTVYLIDHISEEDWSTLCEEIGIDEVKLKTAQVYDYEPEEIEPPVPQQILVDRRRAQRERETKETGNVELNARRGGTANGGDDSITHQMSVTVDPVNDAPVITSAPSDQAINEDTQTGTLAVSIRDVDNSTITQEEKYKSEPLLKLLRQKNKKKLSFIK